jgi:DNA processing protein
MPLTNEQRDWLRLILVPGVGSTNFIRLLARFRTPGQVFAAGEGALRDVVGPALAQRIIE